MVEQAKTLDRVFYSLSDPTRRDILKRVSARRLSVGDIAAHYAISFAGVAKHIEVLKRAGLVRKERRGKEQLVSAIPEPLIEADEYLGKYKQQWEKRLDSLETYLKNKNKSYGSGKRNRV